MCTNSSATQFGGSGSPFGQIILSDTFQTPESKDLIASIPERKSYARSPRNFVDESANALWRKFIRRAVWRIRKSVSADHPEKNVPNAWVEGLGG